MFDRVISGMFGDRLRVLPGFVGEIQDFRAPYIVDGGHNHYKTLRRRVQPR